MKTKFTLLYSTPDYAHSGSVSILPVNCEGQSPITSFSSSYSAASRLVNSYLQPPASGSFAGCLASTYTYTFANLSSNQLKLTRFTANGKSFIVAPGASEIVKLKRVNNANVTGSRSIVFLESMVSPASNCTAGGLLAFIPPYNDVMENFLNNNAINQGN